MSQPMPKTPTLLSDLPDDVLLRIFSFFVTELHSEPHSSDPTTPHTESGVATVVSSAADETQQGDSIAVIPEMDRKSSKSKRKSKSRKGNRVAGLGARTLCRLCCCSHRFNHLASADQLWQRLTLLRFPDRHWPTTDQKKLELIRVRREHQLKLFQASSTTESALTSDTVRGQVKHESDRKWADATKQDHENDDQEEYMNGEAGQEQYQNKKQKRSKFYAKFEQRAYRRRFQNLDPELMYTPLAWTNTLWNWKRTFFGDCRFVEAKDVQTPNRIES
ncbi:hypothetical protein BGX28_006895 [Mortierella sp. GBA30]|nr:hypothetical protein BGX28_006895 [Mortierella sp. GBA30]